MLTASIWQLVAGNLAVVALFVLSGSQFSYWLRPLQPRYRKMLFGVFMGLGAIVSMAMAVQLEPGIYFDLRYSLLAAVALFGGWPAALFATAIAALYRMTLGGPVLFTGLLGIGLASLAGLSVNMLMGRSDHRAWHVGATAVIAAIATALASLSLPGALTPGIVWVLIPAGMLNVVTTFVAGLAYLHVWRLSADRELLAAALAHSPDYAYVKDSFGKFAATNTAAANRWGFPEAKDLVGKDNYAIENKERAQAQLESERTIMQTGVPELGVEEQVVDSDGFARWYATTRVPLRDQSGNVIGLAGVSRDITAHKNLQEELVRSRDTLSYALAEMTSGLAMYDGEARLIFCNEQYRDAFPLTGNLRLPWANYRDILQAVIETGEQVSAPKEGAAAQKWIEERLADLGRESEKEIHLSNGRWLQVRTRPTSNGTTMVAAIDVTRIKQSEQELHSATDQLKHLVRTDGLTGLLNRRAFDDAIDAEIKRTARSGMPLSLVLVDVDRFKDYNDHYGHLSGDEALRQVSKLLKSSLKRPADVVARFGGEEFAAILPDTDEDGAYLVAEGFRRALSDMKLPHAASDKGYLTASVGVATYMTDDKERDAVALIETADNALYSAKAAGRDRVFGTRVTDESRVRAVP